MSFLHDLSTLGGHPNVRVLNLLNARPLGFTDLLCNDSVMSERALGESLRELDRAGLVARRVEPGPPLRVFYALTTAGAQLAPTLEALAAWLDDTAASTPPFASTSNNYA